ncbi:MAG: hypothetical protein J5858_12030, partial [Lentisphaeria bacterium]|nr:hypothetical protein [Lentisphaeria bacterium]
SQYENDYFDYVPCRIVDDNKMEVFYLGLGDYAPYQIDEKIPEKYPSPKPSIWKCPSVKPETLLAKDGYFNGQGYGMPMFSYSLNSLNGHVIRYNGNVSMHKLKDIIHPRDHIILTETNYGYFNQYDKTDLSEGRVCWKRHSDTVNTLRVDGHVSADKAIRRMSIRLLSNEYCRRLYD